MIKNIIHLSKEVNQDLGEDSISKLEEQVTPKQNWLYKIEQIFAWWNKEDYIWL